MSKRSCRTVSYHSEQHPERKAGARPLTLRRVHQITIHSLTTSHYQTRLFLCFILSNDKPNSSPNSACSYPTYIYLIIRLAPSDADDYLNSDTSLLTPPMPKHSSMAKSRSISILHKTSVKFKNNPILLENPFILSSFSRTKNCR